MNQPLLAAADTGAAPWPAARGAHPTRLGKYELLGIVGEGAMGTVYHALDPMLQRSVAVKAIHPHLLREADSDLSIAERFRNEAQAAARLSHPGIVPIYEYGEDGGTAFIAMEYVRGLTLSRYLAACDPLPEDDVLSVAVQVLEALHHAHEQGVWHRDIKPGNLMVTAEGSVKITDFGIARLASSALLPASPHTELLVGSPGYIAPERYAGAAPDRRVDVFSCGVLLYQLLAGEPPFVGSASEVMFQVMHRDPPPPSRAAAGQGVGRILAHPKYDAVVFKALARRPADRYASTLELRDALLWVARRPVSRRLKTSPQQQVWIGEGGSGSASGDLHTRTGTGASISSRTSTRTEVATQPSRPHPPAPAASAAPAPAPTESAPIAHFSRATLQIVGRALADVIGPIAPMLLTRAAARSKDLPTLMHMLAADSLSDDDQQIFFRAVKQGLALQRAGHAAQAAPPTGTPPARTPPARTPQNAQASGRASPPSRVGPASSVGKQRIDTPAGRAGSAAPAVQPDVHPPAAQPPLLDDPATLSGLRPQTIAKAQALLAAHTGPIAAVLVRRALARRSDRDGFFLALADEARGLVDRQGLLRALQKLN